MNTELNLELRPGKGLHTSFNSEALAELRDIVNELEAFVNGNQDSNTVLDDMADSNKAFETHTESLVEKGWVRVDDKFGSKVTRGFGWQEGEIRVTLVKTNRGLALDVRNWYGSQY